MKCNICEAVMEQSIHIYSFVSDTCIHVLGNKEHAHIINHMFRLYIKVGMAASLKERNLTSNANKGSNLSKSHYRISVAPVLIDTDTYLAILMNNPVAYHILYSGFIGKGNILANWRIWKIRQIKV